MSRVVIDRRFNGPPNSGNGGYVCGLIANTIEGPAVVTLRKPPPVGRELILQTSDEGKAVLRDGEIVIGEAVAEPLSLALPEPPSFDEAVEASRRYVGFKAHIFPTCFVCGPGRPRDDGMRLYPGAIPERSIVATPWMPNASIPPLHEPMVMRNSKGANMTANAAFWNGIAEKYAKKPVANPDAFEAKIAITKSHMKPTDVVLDIGCGTGSLALRLAGSAAHVHGLDLSSEMIRIANDKALAQKVDNVTFHTGPFDDTFRAFEPESLDGICAYSLLHLVDDRSAALKQIFGLLKPGGFFISSTVCLGESWVPYGPLIWAMRLVGKAPMVVKTFDKRTLEDEIGQAGFVDLSQPDVGAKPDIAFIVAKKPH